MSIDPIVQQHEVRITKLEVEVEEVKKAVGTVCDDFRAFLAPGGPHDQLQQAVTKLGTSSDTMLVLVKYVIVPLIVIVGGLVGLKIALPGA